MARIRRNNRAAALLAAIADDDGLSLERVAFLAGVSAADLRSCRDGSLGLPFDVQIRVARVIATRVPRLAPLAHRLEEQAAAALAMQDGSTALHLVAPPRWH